MGGGTNKMVEINNRHKVVVKIGGIPINRHEKPDTESLIANVTTEVPKISPIDIIPLASVPAIGEIMRATPVAAQVNSARPSVSGAFDPFIHTLQDIAGPVCFIMIVLGFGLVMVGKPKQGVEKIKWAALGYIGIQWTPMIQDIIRKVGSV